MSEEALQKLQRVVGDHGLERLEDATRWKGLLSDYFCGEHKRELNALVFAVQLQCVWRLQCERSTADAILLPQLAQRLHDELGLDVALAAWAVRSWAVVVGRTPASHEMQSPRRRKEVANENPENKVEKKKTLAEANRLHNELQLQTKRASIKKLRVRVFRTIFVILISIIVTGSIVFVGMTAAQHVAKLREDGAAVAAKAKAEAKAKTQVQTEAAKLAEKNAIKSAFVNTSTDDSGESTHITSLKNAAQSGDIDAQRELGQRYRDGTGILHDTAAAITWLKRAAEQGEVKSQEDLYIIYMNGDGVPRDPTEAKRWHSMAAKAGSAYAKIKEEAERRQNRISEADRSPQQTSKQPSRNNVPNKDANKSDGYDPLATYKGSQVETYNKSSIAAGRTPMGISNPSKRGFVGSPYMPEKGWLDLRGYQPGDKVRCPNSGKYFIVP